MLNKNHKITLMLILASVFLSHCEVKPNKRKLKELLYEGNDLGITRKDQLWVVKVFSPFSEEVRINFYVSGSDEEAVSSQSMTYLKEGVWEYSSDTINNLFYTLQAKHDGIWSEETVDPYVKMVGVNGNRGFIDLPSSHQPEEWENDVSPALNDISESIIYELQIRDFSIDVSSGMKEKGKFTAFTETGSRFEDVSTGIDHLVDLGITHVHLMPAFDFKSIDERTQNPDYNWGYEPLHYNVPEGSFSSDPYTPGVRIREFKEMVMALHNHGIRVVLDVVYNHTADAGSHPFEILAPGYYYRFNTRGEFSNASACGNETASEKPMMRKFMTESMKYWMEEYHVDGFRIDLMAIHDIETVNLISEELRKLDPNVLIYGEGWKAGHSTMSDSLLALKKNTKKLDQVAVFSDELRDGLKGHYANKDDKGFVSGNGNYKESVKFGTVGATNHPQVDFSTVNYSSIPWSDFPTKMIAYASCHDDMTLWDKLKAANPEAAEEELIAMSLLANTAVLTSQGIPFLHGGVDFLRTKYGSQNSFESPDSVNSIKWNKKREYFDVFAYYQSMIRLRKDHPAFRMGSAEMVKKSLKFLNTSKNVIGFELGPHANGDPWEFIRVYLNGSGEPVKADLPEANWKKIIKDRKLRTEGIAVVADDFIPAFSAQIYFR